MTIHQSPIRLEAALKVTGRAVYEAETPMPRILHAALIEAPIARGQVLSLEAGDARGLPGFVDLVTHAEARALNPSATVALIRESCAGLVVHGKATAQVASEVMQTGEEPAHDGRWRSWCLFAAGGREVPQQAAAGVAISRTRPDASRATGRRD